MSLTSYASFIAELTPDVEADNWSGRLSDSPPKVRCLINQVPQKSPT